MSDASAAVGGNPGAAVEAVKPLVSPALFRAIDTDVLQLVSLGDAAAAAEAAAAEEMTFGTSTVFPKLIRSESATEAELSLLRGPCLLSFDLSTSHVTQQATLEETVFVTFRRLRLKRYKAVCDELLPGLRSRSHLHNLIFRDKLNTSCVLLAKDSQMVIGGATFRLFRTGTHYIVLDVLITAVSQQPGVCGLGHGTRLVNFLKRCAIAVRRHRTLACYVVTQADNSVPALNFWRKQLLTPSEHANLMISALHRLMPTKNHVYEFSVPMLAELTTTKACQVLPGVSDRARLRGLEGTALKIECVCDKTVADGRLLKCDFCGSRQHYDCVRESLADAEPDVYLCWRCNNASLRSPQVSATKHGSVVVDEVIEDDTVVLVKSPPNLKGDVESLGVSINKQPTTVERDATSELSSSTRKAEESSPSNCVDEASLQTVRDNASETDKTELQSEIPEQLSEMLQKAWMCIKKQKGDRTSRSAAHAERKMTQKHDRETIISNSEGNKATPKSNVPLEKKATLSNSSSMQVNGIMSSPFQNPLGLVWRMHEAFDKDLDRELPNMPVTDCACSAMLPELSKWTTAPSKAISDLLDSDFLAAARRWLSRRDETAVKATADLRRGLLRILLAFADLVTLYHLRRSNGLIGAIRWYCAHSAEPAINKKLAQRLDQFWAQSLTTRTLIQCQPLVEHMVPTRMLKRPLHVVSEELVGSHLKRPRAEVAVTHEGATSIMSRTVQQPNVHRSERQRHPSGGESVSPARSSSSHDDNILVTRHEHICEKNGEPAYHKPASSKIQTSKTRGRGLNCKQTIATILKEKLRPRRLGRTVSKEILKESIQKMTHKIASIVKRDYPVAYRSFPFNMPEDVATRLDKMCAAEQHKIL